MKAIIFSIVCIACHMQMIAQDIATARQQPLQSVVTVTGIVTNGDELGSPIRYIEDGTAGIAIYDPEVMEGVNRGDSISVTGTLIDYNGLLEIQPASNLVIHSSGNNVNATTISPLEIGEETESEFVRIYDVLFENPGEEFSIGTHNFSANGQSGIIYVKANSDLEGETIPSCPSTMKAIVSQYSFTGFDGYQLLIRDMDDFNFSEGICFSTPMVQTNVSTNGFDISWNTSLEGSTNLSYGLTPNLELGTINDLDGSNSTDHYVSLNNLEPGTIYYIQGFSNNGNDTTFSPMVPFATISTSSGEIRVCFNSSVDTSVATIEYAQQSGVYTNDTIKAYIDKANHTLDIAIYNHSDNMITNAINDAYERGVKVRYITCASTATMSLDDLNDSIPTLERPEENGIMHNKFVIIDANIADSCWVITGSTNWTSNQLFNDPNNLVMIQDQSVARTYEMEFEEMWGSNSDLPDSLNAKFGNEKTNNTPHHFTVGGKHVEIYFSPSDLTTYRIANAISTANHDIDFGLLVFTKNELAWAIEDQFNLGVQVDGIIENINTQGSEFEYLGNLGVNVLSHQGFGNQFHHKYCIIDQANTNSDPLVVTGSHNWSTAAETNNDENTIIIHDANIANQFYQEFHMRMSEIPTVEASFNCVNEACVDPMDGTGTYNSLVACEYVCTSTSMDEFNSFSSYSIYPNPSNGTFHLEIKTNATNNTPFELSDIQGKVIETGQLKLEQGINTFEFNLQLNNGLYLLKIENQYLKITVQN